MDRHQSFNCPELLEVPGAAKPVVANGDPMAPGYPGLRMVLFTASSSSGEPSSSPPGYMAPGESTPVRMAMAIDR
jgi:hypothetical protein